jgi:hypothetical protein
MTPGVHTVGDTAAGTTKLADYTVTIGGACSPTGVVTLNLGDKKACTITFSNDCLAECTADRDFCHEHVGDPGAPPDMECAQVFIRCKNGCH